jgi:hypothetical protein
LRQARRAGLVQFRHGWRSRTLRGRAKPVDGSKDGVHHSRGGGHLGELEGDCAGVTHNARAAISSYQASRATAVTGEPSMGLLGSLL